MAKRDYDVFMLAEGEYASESRIADMRLYVDKALDLLDAKNNLHAENKKVRDMEVAIGRSSAAEDSRILP